MKLVLKILFTTIYVVFFAIANVVALSFFNYDKLYWQIFQLKYKAVAEEVSTSIQYGLDLGVDLRNLERINEIIDQVRNKNKEIKVIKVFDYKGIILFDADPDRIGEEAPALWREKTKEDYEEIFYFSAPPYRLIGIPLLNSFFEREGTLVVGVPDVSLWESHRDVLVYIAIISILGVIAVSIFVYFFIKWLTRDVRAALEKMAGMDEKIVSKAERYGKRVKSSQNRNLVEMYKEFVEHTREVKSDLARLDGELSLLEKLNGKDTHAGR